MARAGRGVRRGSLGVLVPTLSVLAALAPTGGAGQTPRPLFQQLTTDEGLPSDIVWDVLQDRAGFLWFATHGGLGRYDGYEFRIFRHDPDDPLSINSNRVEALFEDRDGFLWIGTQQSGLARYDPDTDAFRRYRHGPDDPSSLGSDAINGVFQDSDGTIWVATDGGLSRISADGSVVRETIGGDGPDRTAPITYAVLQDSRGRFWVGTAAGLLTATSPDPGALAPPSGVPSAADGMPVRDIVEDSDGTIWAATFGAGVLRFGPSGTWTHYAHDPADPGTLGSNLAWAIVPDTDGTIWVSLFGQGLNRIDPTSGRIWRFPPRSGDPRTVGNANMVGGTRSRDGLLWWGSAGGGVMVMDPLRAQMGLVRNWEFDGAGFVGDQGMSIVTDTHGHVWFASLGEGVIRWEPATGRTTRYAAGMAPGRSLPANEVWTLARDSAGSIWAGSWGGLTRFDPVAGVAESYPGLATYALEGDVDGSLWVGTETGLERWEPGTGLMESWTTDPTDSASLSGGRVVSIHQDPTGGLWVMTESGLDRLDPDTRTFEHIDLGMQDDEPVRFPTTEALTSDASGAIWLGTSAGLLRLDPERNEIRRVPLGADRSASLVSALAFDGDGHLWVGTYSGLQRLDPSSGTGWSFDAADGLGPTGISALHYDPGTDRLFVAGSRGFNVFSPGALRRNDFVPQVAITAFELTSGTPMTRYRSGRVTAGDSIALPWSERSFSVELASLSFHAPERSRYRFRLEGLEDAWNEVGSDGRRFRYTNLDPGRYVLRFTASNGDGVWNPSESTVMVRILPPWFMTWWFRGLVVLALLAAIAAAHSIRTRSIRDRNRALQAEVEERLRAEQAVAASEREQRALAGRLRELSGRLISVQEDERRRLARDLHDDVNQRLALMSIELDEASMDTEQPDPELADLLVHLSGRIKELSSDVHRMSRQLHPSQLEALGLGSAMQSYCSEFGRLHGIDVSFSSDLDGGPVPDDVALALYRVAQEALANVQRHANAEEARVIIESDEAGLGLVVTDDGQGFDPDGAGGPGLGLVGMRERLRIVGGTVRIDSAAGHGTTIRAWVPWRE